VRATRAKRVEWAIAGPIEQSNRKKCGMEDITKVSSRQGEKDEKVKEKLWEVVGRQGPATVYIWTSSAFCEGLLVWSIS
jgi:hypothetical protein